MKNRSSTRSTRSANRQAHPAFSLVELLIVILVAMILTGMLMPALSKLRENVNIVVCASNQRQLGMGTSMYSGDHKGNLPSTHFLKDDNWKPEELMAAYTPDSAQGWDGLGILVAKEYCSASDCLYCPSHQGSHPQSKYAAHWQNPGGEVIYGNMHFAGDRDWETGEPRFYRNDSSWVLLMDGLRTISDVNHRFGMNVTYGDMSVRWRSDLVTVFTLLPESEEDLAANSTERYKDIWSSVQKAIMPQ